MTLQEAKDFLASHSNPVEMTKEQLEQYKEAVRVLASNWVFQG